LIGMPVAYALGFSALIGAWWIDIPLEALMIQVAGGVNKFSLLAIPFFVLAGAIMAEGGMSRRLVAFAGVLVGFVRGGLSLVNIMASTFFGAISGSSVADTASIGSVLIPEMERKGYPRDFATAVTVSGSVQAILITAQPQRGDLFAGSRRHRIDRLAVHGWRGTGLAAGAC
jgi:tripartite ATP-independent transporter DctM subunit